MGVNRAVFLLYSLTFLQFIGCTRKNIRPDRPIQIDRGPPQLEGSPVDVFIAGYDGAEGLPVAAVQVIKYESKPSSFDDAGESFSLGRSGKTKISNLKSGETYYFAAKLLDSAGNTIALTQFGDLRCDVMQVVASNQVSIRTPVCKYEKEDEANHSNTNSTNSNGNINSNNKTNVNIKIETPK
jgi:hypothetical protein